MRGRGQEEKVAITAPGVGASDHRKLLSLGLDEGEDSVHTKAGAGRGTMGKSPRGH